MRHTATCLTLLLTLPCLQPHARGQVFDERYTDWPEQTFISGTVVVAPSLDNPSLLKDVLPKSTADKKAALVTNSDVPAGWIEDVKSLFEDEQLSVHSKVSFAEMPSLLKDALTDVDVLILQAEATAGNVTAKLREELKQLLKRGGVLVLVGPGVVLAGSQQTAMQLIPGAVMQLNGDAAQGDHTKLGAAVESQPRTFGISLSEDSVLVLKRRIFRVLGDGSATFMVPKGDWLPERIQVLKQRSSRRQDPNKYLVDLIEWRREAIERTLEQFPPENPPMPRVENGTLVIVGGGGMPDGLMQRFVDLSGGNDDARLVYIPCAEETKVSAKQRMVAAWKNMGVQHATFLHTKDRHKANTDDEFLKPLVNATGIWFGGGRQWNMADSYYGTKAHKLMKEVLQRGGVIGGSSAGASIQARYLARATPIQNFRIMAPGYERGGLGFIGGVAIDQHFSQRGRQKDMSRLVAKYPQLLGIGIDESTALIVTKTVGEVVGDGKVFFYDQRRTIDDDQADFEALPAGSSYDLLARKVILDATVEPDPE